jgi:hypothetical protein
MERIKNTWLIVEKDDEIIGFDSVLNAWLAFKVLPHF